jgi:uncharacterized protein YfaS (alpha-2-macroglobulin family)
VDRKETTDDQGRLTMVVPADMDLSTRGRGPAQLTAIVGGGSNQASVTLPLPVRPARYVTRLWLDRQSYRPGDTVYYRSLTVSRCNLVAPRALAMEFEILDPKSIPLPESRTAGITDHGVGNGWFRLPKSLAAGNYMLVARGADGVFPEERLTFAVAGPPTQRFQVVTKFARDSYGPGDDVAADLLLKRPDGKPVAGASVQLSAKVDGQTIFQKIAKADGAGRLPVEFVLPRHLHQGHGELIVEIDAGDRTDRISEAIPVRSGQPHIDFFP